MTPAKHIGTPHQEMSATARSSDAFYMQNIQNHAISPLIYHGLWHNGLKRRIGPTKADLLGKTVQAQQLLNTAQGRPWMRFMLLGLVALVWIGRANEARGSCGYYVVIGHPSAQTAAEQARVRHEQMPLEQNKTPCDGPQCRGQNRPLTPAAAPPVSLQDPMTLAVMDQTSAEIDFSLVALDHCLFLSNPHIWRSDPPPRA
jgi:hypothetical protein